MNLCDECRKSIVWPNTKTRNHHPTRKDWMQAVEQGCNICSLLCDTLSPGVAEYLEDCDLKNIKNIRWSPAGCINAFLTWTNSVGLRQNDNPSISLKVTSTFEGFKGPLPLIANVDIVQTDQCQSFVSSSSSLLETLGSSTDSDAAWDMMRHWISECQQNHVDSGLRMEEAAPWYPTRLLDLGDPNSTSVPRLIETATSIPQGPYLSLSHCWGTKYHICATKDNLKTLYVGISGLPKTFLHAIAATRNLGYRYLWIDSLCIVQDDEQDWAREAALMHKVYTNADCNLAATASQDSSGGLFFERHGLRGQCVAKIEGGGRIDSFVDRILFWREIHDAPLHNRAWVYQEWLMSKRTIHFARNQVFWECDHLCACEVFPDGLPDCIRYNGKKRFAGMIGNATSMKKREMDVDGPETGTTLLPLWLNLVMEYTKRKLTKSRDRLPALSGIAKWLQPHLDNPQYLAGLWNNANLTRQLTWSLCSPKNPRPHYRAPSWSWAAIDGHVLWTSWFGVFTPGLDIIEASTTPSGSDPTGSVSRGHLLVKGNMARVNIIEHETWPILLREYETQETSNRATEMQNTWDNPNVIFQGFDVSGLPFGQYYVLLLGTVETDINQYEDASAKEYTGCYLVLRPVEGQTGTFERCGTVEEHYTGANRHQTLTARRSWDRQDIPCVAYVEDEGTCVIRIV
ncbi:het-domain protein [Fusarium beomiforme]|uniref:Het-domain protein n=1 Tax=Fusarium beomiforme TaxID=44412 RepID=A0A9P5AFE1_9HYPO|nr:het-domain protein [Fusarium beomiforme]